VCVLSLFFHRRPVRAYVCACVCAPVLTLWCDHGVELLHLGHDGRLQAGVSVSEDTVISALTVILDISR
jgi:hypothetical protein